MTDEIQTDFPLAAELQETAVWIVERYSPASAQVQMHLDRIARAVAFLRGQRTVPATDLRDVRRLVMTDPVCHAIDAYARQSERARIESEAR